MTATDQMRAMLDQLMGTSRNGKQWPQRMAFHVIFQLKIKHYRWATIALQICQSNLQYLTWLLIQPHYSSQ